MSFDPTTPTRYTSENMEKDLWKDFFDSLEEAIKRLAEVLQLPDVRKIDYLQDAVIQRFEFCFEFYGRVLKKFLYSEGVATTTSMDVFKKAYQFDLIDDGKIWIQMIHDRNRISHKYSQEHAKKIFENILIYWPVIEKNYAKLKVKFYAS